MSIFFQAKQKLLVRANVTATSTPNLGQRMAVYTGRHKPNRSQSGSHGKRAIIAQLTACSNNRMTPIIKSYDWMKTSDAT